MHHFVLMAAKQKLSGASDAGAERGMTLLVTLLPRLAGVSPSFAA
jgi:hypothetical protein